MSLRAGPMLDTFVCGYSQDTGICYCPSHAVWNMVIFADLQFFSEQPDRFCKILEAQGNNIFGDPSFYQVGGQWMTRSRKKLLFLLVLLYLLWVSFFFQWLRRSWEHPLDLYWVPSSHYKWVFFSKGSSLVWFLSWDNCPWKPGCDVNQVKLFLSQLYRTKLKMDAYTLLLSRSEDSAEAKLTLYRSEK